jgi:NodT family efflux transporter outer membrane factor (OMF) lipoprotein
MEQKMKQLIRVALATPLLAACVTAPAPQPAPSPPAPAQWQAALPHNGSSSDLTLWWSQFNDPVLVQLQAAAQQASPQLASALARIERARAARVGADAAAWPRLDAVGSVGTGRSAPGQPSAQQASLGLQAGWELDLFGGVAAGRRSEWARWQGAHAAWHDARVSLAAEVATSYTALRACEAQLITANQDADSRAQTTRLTELSAKAGLTAPADAALVRGGAAQSRSQAISQRAQCDTLVKGLVEATDVAEAELRRMLAPSRAQLPQPRPLAPTSLPAQLLNQRPDLAQAAHNVAAAAADQSRAQAQQRPQVVLMGSLSAVSLRSQGLQTNGTTWSLGPLSVNLPLFDAGLRAANTEAAKASYAEAVALYAAQLRRAVREVESALVALDATAQREVDAQAAALDFEASLIATQARQKGGLASVLDLEVARRNALQAQSALIELKRERAAAWITLYRALGGGWNPAELNATAPKQP